MAYPGNSFEKILSEMTLPWFQVDFEKKVSKKWWCKPLPMNIVHENANSFASAFGYYMFF